MPVSSLSVGMDRNSASQSQPIGQGQGVPCQPGHSLAPRPISLAPRPAASGSLCPKPGLKHLLNPGLEGGEAAREVSRKHREVWCKEGCLG